MAERLGYGFIGCGMMGQEHIRNLALIPGSQVVAAVEPDPSMQQIVRSLVPHIRFVDSIEDLLKRRDVDALIITTPNFQHADQLQQIMTTSKLPVLVEKPVCTSWEDIDVLRQLAANYPSPIWVGMEYRYMPPIEQLRKELAEQSAGPIKMLSIREHRFPFLEKVNDWNRFNKYTGGTLVEKCCHFFDLMRLLLDDEPVRLFASGGIDVNHKDEHYKDGSPDIIDNAYVIVDFKQGTRAMLELCMFAEGSPYQEEISLVGDVAKLECLIPGPARFWPTRELGQLPVPKLIRYPRNPKGPTELDLPVDQNILDAGDHNGSTFYQHLRFRDAILHGKSVEVTLDDGLAAVAMGLAAQRSIKEGRSISLG